MSKRKKKKTTTTTTTTTKKSVERNPAPRRLCSTSSGRPYALLDPRGKTIRCFKTRDAALRAGQKWADKHRRAAFVVGPKRK